MNVSQDFINKYNKHDVCFLYINQAGDTVDEFLLHAIEAIDSALGKGFAKKNPALIGDCVKAAVDSLAVIRQGDQAYRQAKKIEYVSDSIDRLAHNISGIDTAIEQAGIYSEIRETNNELSGIDSSLSEINRSIETSNDNLSEISASLARLVSIKPDGEVG